MRLLGDITTNHCGDAHPWFLAAAADAAAAEREMFYFDGDDYESWNGVKSLPKLNWGSAELRRRFVDAEWRRRWLRPPFNLDGWRVDVANMTGRRGARRLHPRRGPARCAARVRQVQPEGCWWPSTATTPPATSTGTAGTAR